MLPVFYLQDHFTRCHLEVHAVASTGCLDCATTWQCSDRLLLSTFLLATCSLSWQHKINCKIILCLVKFHAEDNGIGYHLMLFFISRVCFDLARPKVALNSKSMLISTKQIAWQHLTLVMQNTFLLEGYSRFSALTLKYWFYWMFAILWDCTIVFNWATVEIHCCCFSWRGVRVAPLYFGVPPLHHLSIVWLCLALFNGFLLNCRAGIEAPRFEAAQRLLFCRAHCCFETGSSTI